MALLCCHVACWIFCERRVYYHRTESVIFLFLFWASYTQTAQPIQTMLTIPMSQSSTNITVPIQSTAANISIGTTQRIASESVSTQSNVPISAQILTKSTPVPTTSGQITGKIS